MHFRDIPQFTRSPAYAVNIDWVHLEHTLTRWLGADYNLDLDPDFQRGHVWTTAQQTAFVEYGLRGGRARMDLLFNCPGWREGGNTDFVLVDGKQRLEAVRKFLRNELQVFGHLYRGFEGKLGIMGPSFKFCVNDLKTRAEVLAWYLELNEGGVVHTKEELDRVRELRDEALPLCDWCCCRIRGVPSTSDVTGSARFCSPECGSEYVHRRAR